MSGSDTFHRHAKCVDELLDTVGTLRKHSAIYAIPLGFSGRRERSLTSVRRTVAPLNVCMYSVHPTAVAMVQTKVKPISFSGECCMVNWDMIVGAIDPHHTESFKPICHKTKLRRKCAIYRLNSVFLRRAASNREFAHKWRMCDAIMCY